MLVECVPNFSEGRRREALTAIVAAIASVDEARVVDHSMDVDHHRAVVTFVAPPAAVGEAAFRGVRAAIEQIDLTRHAGVHPRIGAADVVPLIPLEGVDLATCAKLARELGARIGRDLGVPVYYYGAAAVRPERASLARVRRGGFEGLRAALERGEPGREPDAGPARVHPTAGATAVGARNFLIAYNVELETSDVQIAKDIAARIRARDGGLPGVLAMGVLLGAGPGARAQVSTNVCDHQRAGLIAVFAAIEREAALRGVGVRRSELIGLAPRAALDGAIAERIRLAPFDPARQILEERIA